MARPANPNARASLVAAAREQFAKRGLRGARVEDITAACGLSKGAFYLHFESKERLFAELRNSFLSEIGACAVQRHGRLQRFAAERGALEARDVREHTARYGELFALELEEDLRTLELLWKYRDVVSVLISGCQGTRFEGSFWELLEAQEEEVVRLCEEKQRAGLVRGDTQPELFASIVVGAYFLLAKRMGKMRRKPDLRLWAELLKRLVNEAVEPAPARKPVPLPARSRS